jgi:hypothetical protein
VTTPGLDQTCDWIAEFIGLRASRGDVVARGFLAGLKGTKHAPPPMAMVRQWLANVASEVRIIRPDGTPATAERLQAQLRVAEKQAPGSTERAWSEYVARRRAGGR